MTAADYEKLKGYLAAPRPRIVSWPKLAEMLHPHMPAEIAPKNGRIADAIFAALSRPLAIKAAHIALELFDRYAEAGLIDAPTPTADEITLRREFENWLAGDPVTAKLLLARNAWEWNRGHQRWMSAICWAILNPNLDFLSHVSFLFPILVGRQVAPLFLPQWAAQVCSRLAIMDAAHAELERPAPSAECLAEFAECEYAALLAYEFGTLAIPMLVSQISGLDSPAFVQAIRGFGAAAIPALREVIDADGADLARTRVQIAACLLAELGEADAAIFAALDHMLTTKEVDTVDSTANPILALLAVVKRGEPIDVSDSALTAILDAIERENHWPQPAIYHAALEILVSLGERARPFLLGKLPNVKIAQPYRVVAWIGVLAALDILPDDFLGEALRHTSAKVRKAALNALSGRTAIDERWAEPIGERLRDAVLSHRRQALGILLKMGERAAGALASVSLELLAGEKPVRNDFREWVPNLIRALGRIGPAAQDYVYAIETAVTESGNDSATAVAAKWALARILTP